MESITYRNATATRQGKVYRTSYPRKGWFVEAVHRGRRKHTVRVHFFTTKGAAEAFARIFTE